MNVALDPETEKLVQAELQSGRFQDATALIGTALKHFLIAREFDEEYTREEIEAKIKRGLSQLEARRRRGRRRILLDPAGMPSAHLQLANLYLKQHDMNAARLELEA